MSKEYGYIGKEVTQAFRDNKGIFTPQDIIELDQENKWTNFGQLELIQTTNASGSTTVDFTDIKSDVFDVHFFTFNNIDVTADSDRLKLRYFESGVVESGSVYEFATEQCDTGGFSVSQSTSSDNVPTIKNSGNQSNEHANGYTYIYNAGDSTKFTFNTYHSTTLTATPTYNSWFGSGLLPQASFVDGFRLFSSGNISGSISLYGIRSF
jgi:hypothetical protein